MSDSVPPPTNFIRQIVEDDLRSGRHQQVVTRFPPEPNGYLHIGHAKAICVDFGLPLEFGGRCHLRMDDTNPQKESDEYVVGIQRDLRWLGFDWGEHFYHASDYFDQLFDWAKLLIRDGLAYVDEQTEDQIRTNRGTVDSPGVPSPWRERPVAESLAKFDQMAAGTFPDGAMVLRAKIDMGHPNMKLRDPLMYRIRNVPHHRTGDKWHVYPLYDWAHGQSDAIEGITHSLCSLEFDVNRELYDWFLDHLPVPSRPHQYEFARLNIAYTMMSKRNLLALVQEKIVSGWDDPRMPTLAGMRRRGVTPAAIRAFVERVGVAKAASIIEPTLLDNAIRDDLNDKSPRLLAVMDPITLVIDGWPEDRVEWLDAPYWPHDVPNTGSRPVPFTGTLAIERDDFAVQPIPGFKRLAPGRAVRLRHGWVVTSTGHETDAAGRVTTVRCALVEDSRGKNPADTKVWATIHWVSKAHAVPVEVRLYDPLFAAIEPGKDRDFHEDLSPSSLTVVEALGEPALREVAPGSHVQLERIGYFYAEPETSVPGAPVLNRTVALKDSWAKAQAANEDAVTERIDRPAQPAVGRQGSQKPTVRTLGDAGRALVAAGLSEDEASVLEADAALRAWYDAALAVHPSPAVVGSWVVTELVRVARERGGLAALPFGGDALGALVGLVDGGRITQAVGKQVLGILAVSGGDPAAIVAERGLAPMTDPAAVAAVVDEVLAAFPDRVEAYRGGRTGLLGFFVGQVMQRTGGRTDPQDVRAALERKLA
ncbi:MAG: glutamine--tRNA ligase/YqeY domain fusion protein [Myxococcota bacterium]